MTIQLEGFLTMKEVEERVSVLIQKADIKQGQTGLLNPNLQMALQRVFLKMPMVLK